MLTTAVYDDTLGRILRSSFFTHKPLLLAHSHAIEPGAGDERRAVLFARGGEVYCD
jgi:hypothetical protein